MKAVLTAAVLMATLSACTPARATEITDLGFQRTGKPAADYDLRVSFGSVCCGIDTVAYERVAAAVKASPAPTTAEVWGWGREGERTIGLRFAGAAETAAFKRELLALRARLEAEGPKRTGSQPNPAFEVVGG